jgi:Asp-tRNA(Asn)/Glu-tRNA(Gln) amidotransferase A subunit family amidase
MTTPNIKRRAFLSRSSQALGAVMASMAIPAMKSRAADTSLRELSASAAVDAMRKGDIKAEEYAGALLKRAKELESLNAFRALNPEIVLEAARAADKARAFGGKLGMLHGLPIPVKDSVNTKALPTSNGTLALRDFRPKDDAAVLKPLFAQGAILMGKTNLHELAFGWTSNNDTFGAVHNPYNQAHIPGGSSGGSAAAVAARIAPLAVAEDTHGSIRVPAACCGLAGLRPTVGRYSDTGIAPLTQNKFDQVGPLARSVADLALFDIAITGDTRAFRATPLKGVRIGVSPGFFFSGLDPQVERVTKEAFQKLRDAGVTIVEAEVPEIVTAAPAIVGTIIRYETVPSITQFLKEQQTGLTFEQLFAEVSEKMKERMRAVAIGPNRPTQETYEASLIKREQLKDAIRRYFEEQRIVALAFPTTMTPPPKIGEDEEVEISGHKIPLPTALARNVALGSCAGLPGLALPAGTASNGLPIGITFDAPAGKDRDLLALGLSLEKALGSIAGPKI